MNSLHEQAEAVKKMGVANLTSVWEEDDHHTLQQEAAKRCNLTPDVIKAIENGEEIWIRNNVTGFIDRAMKIRRHHSDEDLDIWRAAETEPLRKATGKAYWMECREKGYEIRDWAYLEKVQRPRSETPWLTSVAIQSDGTFGISPVVICGHGLDQMDTRQILQDEVVLACIHGHFIQGSGKNTGQPDDRVVKSFFATDRRDPHGPKRELRVVIKKNYDAHCCEVITAWWADQYPENK